MTTPTVTTLPLGWREMALGEVAEVNPRHFDTPPDDREISFVPMAAVEEETGRLDANNRRLYGEMRKKSYRRFHEGDVLVAKITPSMENGKAALAMGLEAGLGMGSTEFHVLRPSPGLDARYLLHYVLQKNFRADAARSMTGTAGQLRVPADFLREKTIPVPPIDEQRRIVEAIETHLSHLDAGVESLQRAKKNVERMRTAVFASAVSGQLVDQDSTDEDASELWERLLEQHRAAWIDGEVAKLDARGKAIDQRSLQRRYPAPSIPSPEVNRDYPPGWIAAPFGALAIIDAGPAFKSRHFVDEGKGTRLLRGENIEPGRLRWSDTKTWPDDLLEGYEYLLVGEDDLILAMDRPLISTGLKLARVRVEDLPALLLQRVARIRPVGEVSTDFLFLLLSAPQFVPHLIRSQTGTQLPHINLASIRDFVVGLPPLEEQKRIVAESDRQLSVLESMRDEVDRKLQMAGRLRGSILMSAFAGDLTDSRSAA